MKGINEMGKGKKKSDARGFLDRLADMLPDALGGYVVKAKRKRKKKIEKPLT